MTTCGRIVEPVTEIDVAKNRDGETKTHYLKHDMAICQYEEMTNYTPPAAETKKGKF